MSGTRFAILVTVLVVSQWICINQCSAQPEHYGFPPKLTDLTWLTPILEEKLIPFEKTEILATWLIREIQDPSPTATGLGGGDITSGYIQAQILTALFVEGDPLTISEIALDKYVDDDVQNGMRIALGLMGDSTQIPTLIDILENHHELYFRQKAAEALGLLGATEAIPALQKALEDAGSVTSGNCIEGVYTGYPVRRSAKEALNVLEDSERIKAAKERNRAFAKRFQNLQQSMVSLRDTLEKRGWTITWDAKNKVACAMYDKTQLCIEAGKDQASLNSSEIHLGVPSTIASGQMQVPQSFIARIVYETQPLAQLARASKPIP